MSTQGRCLICKTEGATLSPDGGGIRVACRQCRLFSISGTAEAVVQSWSHEKCAWLSGRARRHWIATKRHYKVTSDLLDTVDGPELVRVLDKQNALLADIAADSKAPGDEIERGSSDRVAIDAVNLNELIYHRQSLVERGLLKFVNSAGWVVITAQGWEHLEQLRFPIGGNRSDFFVAMSFDPSLVRIFKNGIEPGAADAGYNAKRVDSIDHNDKIDDRIIAGIRASFGLIADVTTRNAGAYFEAGFALGLGRPVVWTVRADDLDKLHFDTRQFRHIVWKDEADLRSQLAAHLLAIFGRGPVPPT
jgi:hypothetical protein